MPLFHHYCYTTSLSHTSQYDTYRAYPENDPEHSLILKLFDAKCILPTVTLEDFQRVERRLQGLQHPHIVAMLALGREQGRPYLVSEYHAGGSLREHLDHLPSGHLSLDNTVAIVMQVGQAVAFAHTQGVLHQDIRPENILLNEQDYALLTNFFLSDIMRVPGLKDRSDRRAISYLAPEQTIGIASPASDQYALGCLLYELLTGKLPNPVSSQRLHVPQAPMLPRSLEMLILRALALEPEERYPSITTFLAELKLATQPESSVSLSIIERAPAHIPSFGPFSGYEQAQPVTEDIPVEDFVAVMERYTPWAKTEVALAEDGVVVTESHTPLGKIETIPVEDVVVATESSVPSNEQDQPDQKEEQLAIPIPQDAPKSTPKVPRTMIVRASPTWKRPVGVIGVAVILLVIALLLASFFHTGARPQVKHVSTLAISTPISSPTTVPATAVPVTTNSTATPQSTVTQTPNQNPVVGTPSQPAPTATPKPLGIGSVQIDSGGSGTGSFVGDEDFSDTTPSRPSSESHDPSNVIDTSTISNAAPQSVYQSARFGDCLYTIAHLTPHASYAVRLHFAEIYWTQPGKRTFNVTLNGHLVLSNFDIFATAGGANKAVVEQFVVPADNTGTITLQFQTVKNNALINAIEVLAV